jgi:exosortase O
MSAIAFRWLVDIPQIDLLLFVLGTYGLCGLFLTPTFWRKGLSAAALVACVLPFSAQFGTGLGFPVRVLTAHAVERLLSFWQITAISSHDIIVLENGIAHVDLPCSGLKSLWTGTLFLIAATWLEGRQVGARWVLVCFSNLLFLSSANTARVLVLVLITHVWQQPQITQILHVPLGLLGFIGSCALAWVMLQTVPRNSDFRLESVRQGRKVAQSYEQPQNPKASSVATGTACPDSSQNLKRTQSLLLGFVIVLALMAPLRPVPEMRAIAFHWPQQMVSERISLTPAEQSTFNDSATVTSDKLRFTLGNLSGSMLLVTSTAWYAYHPPELCLVGNGLKVDWMKKKWLTPEVKARWLSLQDGKLSAAYWFQSPQRTTDDFLARIWDYVSHRQKTWVLVSILFDRLNQPDSPDIQAFTTTIHDVIARELKRT